MDPRERSQNLPALWHPGNFISRQLFRLRIPRYVWVALICYALIGLVVYLYLQRSPVFSSSLAVVLPGSGSSSSFSIDEVGQANQSTNTAFGNASFNPLVNYKAILTSTVVLKNSALRLGVGLDSIERPQVELRDSSSLLFVYAQGGSPTQAEQLAWALYESFQESLDALRLDETQRRDDSIRNVLDQYRQKLASTRAAIIEFQQRALLMSMAQLDQLVVTLSDLNSKRLSVKANLRSIENFVNRLSLDVGVSPSLAGQAFRLQSDAEFRGFLKELDESAGLVAQYSSRWGSQHPKVVAQKLRYDAARQALKRRSQELLGTNSSDALFAMDLQYSPQRSQLFAQLLDSAAQLSGLTAELNELDLADARLNDRLKIFTREASELERLEREHQLAEAVFMSAAARLESGKADVFSSYPAVQLLATPSLPIKAKSPDMKIALAIAALGFLCITFGLLTLWHRTFFINLLLKSE
ncbi:GumC family protein [Reinekea forsetii]|uniref:Polysaccharide chain length determinant N-terminal domain-containing protein n=2 Tax=Reinekea forsetii TaxID=1336806 RepID=A0A2K8KTJ2_9GAMM|nr:hypothetical protein [Reinekea forsetii]ATX78048.1 hypothetical protein REIFOR_02927 [Reinekea forsetii]